MKDVVKTLLESSVKPQFDFITENTNAFNSLRVATESENSTKKYNLDKVIVCQTSEGKYVVEFSNNLSRYMKDADVGINEAMERVADHNDINVRECTVLFDESSIDMIDIKSVIDGNPKFNIAR
jgi:hypothetical protein